MFCTISEHGLNGIERLIHLQIVHTQTSLQAGGRTSNRAHVFAYRRWLLTTTIPFLFDCNSTALWLFDDLRYDRRPDCVWVGCCTEA